MFENIQNNVCMIQRLHLTFWSTVQRQNSVDQLCSSFNDPLFSKINTIFLWTALKPFIRTASWKDTTISSECCLNGEQQFLRDYERKHSDLYFPAVIAYFTEAL